MLVLNSYHPGYVWGDSVINGIREEFQAAGLAVNIRYEYMDTKHQHPEKIFPALRHLLALKYNQFQFDVLIAADNNALTFLLEHREEIFTGVPVVFCGINGYIDELLTGTSGYTGFGEYADIKATLDLALRLHPETEHVAYVSGSSPSSLINQARMKELLPYYSDRLSFINLSMLAPRELSRRLRQLPERTIIMYLSYYKMTDGTFLTVRDSIDMVRRSVNLPIYSPWSYTLGFGTVGGMMLSGMKEGRRAASYAMQILEGIPPEKLPIVFDNEIEPMFDYSLLSHFNIPLPELPPESRIINEPKTLYYRYKYWIWAMAAFACYQTATIVWLSHILIRKRRAERQQKQLEKQLVHSQKMKALGTFAGGVAHDLNNIFGAISTCSELALDDTAPTSPAHDDLHHIRNAADRGKSLVCQLLDFSKNREPERKPLNMAAIVDECVHLLSQPGKELFSVRVTTTPENVVILGDPAQMHQVIMNLCTNGAQALQGCEGKVCITLARHLQGSSNSPCSPALSPGEYVRLTVQDSGCGMSEEVKNRIFEPFFTTRGQATGTGLGLAVVHGIVNNYGGDIEVSSVPGEGTTFTVYLPAATGAVEVEPVTLPLESSLKAKENSRIRVLLVDDDPDVLYSARKILEGEGFEVVALDDGHKAVTLFSSDPGSFALIVTDLVMPGKTGVEVIEACRVLNPGVEVILSSGHAKDYDLRVVKAVIGAHAFLKKPYNREQLILHVRQVLSSTSEK